MKLRYYLDTTEMQQVSRCPRTGHFQVHLTFALFNPTLKSPHPILMCKLIAPSLLPRTTPNDKDFSLKSFEVFSFLYKQLESFWLPLPVERFLLLSF